MCVNTRGRAAVDGPVFMKFQVEISSRYIRNAEILHCMGDRFGCQHSISVGSQLFDTNLELRLNLSITSLSLQAEAFLDFFGLV